MFIETTRLILRDFKEIDFDDYFDYIMDDHLQYMLGLNDVTDRASALDGFRWLMNNREFIAIQKKEDNKVIGHICAHPPFESIANSLQCREKQGVSLSYALKASEQRKDLMTEAMAAFIGFLHEDKKLDFIDCEYSSFNIPSKELQKKLGFQEWGTETFDDVELVVNVLEF